jgi:hypothetical protein
MSRPPTIRAAYGEREVTCCVDRGFTLTISNGDVTKP